MGTYKVDFLVVAPTTISTFFVTGCEVLDFPLSPDIRVKVVLIIVVVMPVADPLRLEAFGSIPSSSGNTLVPLLAAYHMFQNLFVVLDPLMWWKNLGCLLFTNVIDILFADDAEQARS